MLVIAVILLVVFVFGFVAVCGFAAYKVPRWSVQRKDNLVAATRFLVFRFRFDSWWFGVPLLLRGPLINLPVVLATDYPPIQIVAIATILTTGMVLQMLAWPWKVPMLNLTDCIVSFCIVLLVTTSALYLNEIDEGMYAFASGVSTAMLSGIGIAVGIMFFMTIMALFYRSAMGGRKELKFFNLGSTPSSEDLAKRVKDLVSELEDINAEDLATRLKAMSVFDTKKITTCITLLATEVAPPAEECVSFKFNKRISSASFDPSLKRKEQSRPTLAATNEDANESTNEASVETSEEPNNQEWI